MFFKKKIEDKFQNLFLKIDTKQTLSVWHKN